jgi:hypothetical protein
LLQGANVRMARRPDGTDRPRYRDGHGRKPPRHVEREVDAQRWLDEVTAAMVTGDYVDPAAADPSAGAGAPGAHVRSRHGEPAVEEVRHALRVAPE